MTAPFSRLLDEVSQLVKGEALPLSEDLHRHTFGNRLLAPL